MSFDLTDGIALLERTPAVLEREAGALPQVGQ